jgi:hypothetical protein
MGSCVTDPANIHTVGCCQCILEKGGDCTIRNDSCQNDSCQNELCRIAWLSISMWEF